MIKNAFSSQARLMVVCLAGFLGFAAPYAQARQGDPPSRVARISYIDGSVSLQPDGAEEWGSAARNRPVTIGDKIWVDKDSRLELQAGQASIHAGSMTALSFLNLDRGITQMRVAEGSINFRVRELREGDLYEVDTPNAAFTVSQAGAFRIDVTENGDGTRVTIIRGEGEVIAGGQNYVIHRGERAEFNGLDHVDYNISREPAPDDLDRWASKRDSREDRSISSRYVSRDIVGYSDLDDYGDWNEVPEYGHVWYPRVVRVGWAPYSVGYWNWVGPWGWTWVDEEPWGFAPFHYGRWAYIGGAWGWCPGPIYAEPIYGPAFVGFIGGSHWSVGFGFGHGIGWFPLGYGEYYRPWYQSSGNYIRNVNINNTNITNVNINNTTVNNYTYAQNPNAVTAASHNTFINGEHINRSAARITQASLRGAEVTGPTSLTPTQQSFTGAANVRAHMAMPPAAVENRQVVVRTAPPPQASGMPARTIRAGPIRTGGRMANDSATNGENRSAATGASGPATGVVTVPSRASSPATSDVQTSPRQRELFQNRPPSARPDGANSVNGSTHTSIQGQSAPSTPNYNGSQSQGASTNRPVSRQSTTRESTPPSSPTYNRPPQAGVHPQDNSNAPAISPITRGSMPPSSPAYNRPPQSGFRSQHNSNVSVDRAISHQSMPPAANYSSDRPNPANSNRSYTSPQRPSTPYDSQRSYSPQSNNSPSRSYPEPNRGYSAPPQPRSAPTQTYSAPGGGYSAPSRTYSAPSPSYSAPHTYTAPSHNSPATSAPSNGGYRGGNNGGNGGGDHGHPHR
ncbi:MAG TPA: DUF6600 domain-containing protein [Candidatus Dormibacteraeota bacterium]|nr:DUF6600 domain-containing protein [Candidatus Dormibacteraeota bacterium]